MRAYEFPYLLSGDVVGVRVGLHSAGVHGRHPGVALEPRPHHQPIGPARDDGLVRGVARRVVEVAALELTRLYLGIEVEERCPNRNEPYRKG